MFERRLDCVAEAVCIRSDNWIIDETIVVGIRRVVWGERKIIRTDTHKYTGLIGMLEVSVFHVKLTIVVDQFCTDTLVVVANEAVITGQDCGLPGGRAAVKATGGGRIRTIRIQSELYAFFVVHPFCAGRLDQHGRVEAYLLVCRRSIVVMGKDNTEAAINTLYVDHRVGKPTLHCATRTHPLFCELGRTEERMIGRV